MKQKKIIKNVLTIVLTAMLMLCLVSYSPVNKTQGTQADIALSLKLDKEQIKPLDEVTVTLAVDSFESTLANDTTPQVNAITATIPIDTDVFEFVRFTDSQVHFVENVGASYSDTGKSVKIAGFNVNTNGYDFDTTPLLVEFVLKVKADAQLGKTVNLELKEAVFSNLYYVDDTDYSYVLTTDAFLYAVEAPTLTAIAETVKGKKDGVINGLTTAMEYRKDDETSYTKVNDANMTWAADTYFVRYAAVGNYAASEEVKVVVDAGKTFKVTVPASQTGYSLTVDDAELGYGEKATLTYKLSDGYKQTESFAIKVNGTTIALTDGKYVLENATEDMTVTVEGVVNVTAPVITGIVDGATYCESVEFTVSDDSSYMVTVDGASVQAVDNKYTIKADGKSHTVVAEDIDGNKTTVAVTVNDGHIWKTPTFTWATDYSSAKAEFICDAESAHKEIKDCIVSMETTKEPTTTQKGEKVYTAKVVLDGKTYTDVKTQYTDETVGSADDSDSESETGTQSSVGVGTGDNSGIVLWLALILASGVGFVSVMSATTKRENR